MHQFLELMILYLLEFSVHCLSGDGYSDMGWLKVDDECEFEYNVCFALSTLQIEKFQFKIFDERVVVRIKT